MRRWLLAGGIAVPIVVVLVLVIGFTAGQVSNAPNANADCVAGTGTIAIPKVGLTPAAQKNISIAVAQAQQMNIPKHGWQVMIAVMLEESGARNLANPTVPESEQYPHDGDGTDHDSINPFQQRPSQGWGAVKDLMQVNYAAKQFLTRLLQVPGWATLPVTVAAQSVQHSAFPDIYANGAAQAQQIVDGMTGTAETVPCQQDTSGTAAGSANGQAVVAWAKTQLGTIYMWGGSCTGTPGSRPRSQDCDCSSLSQQSWLNGGKVALPRTADAQWEALKAAGKALPIDPATDPNWVSKLQAGDLIFNEMGESVAPTDPGHVSIAIGDGKNLIEASQDGTPVWIRPVYAERFVGIARP